LSDWGNDVSDWRRLESVLIALLEIHGCLSLWLIIGGGIKVILRIVDWSSCSWLNLALHCHLAHSLYLQFLMLFIQLVHLVLEHYMKFGRLLHVFLHFLSYHLIGLGDLSQLILSYLIVLLELANYLKSHVVA
jgi:hypothetical protein